MTDLQGAAISSPLPQPTQASHELKNDQKAFVSQVSENPSFSSKLSLPLLIALIALGVVILEFLFTFGLSATANSKIATQTNIINTNTAQIQTGSLKDINAQATQIANGIKVYAAFKQNSKDYSTLWNDIKTRIVANTRIKTLSIDQTGLVKIDGEAKDFSDIAVLIASLEKSQSLTNIVLVSSNAGDTTKDFSLTAHYTPTAVQGGTNGTQ